MAGPFIKNRIVIGGAQDMPAGEFRKDQGYGPKLLYDTRAAGLVGHLPGAEPVQENPPTGTHRPRKASKNAGSERRCGKLEKATKRRVERSIWPDEIFQTVG